MNDETKVCRTCSRQYSSERDFMTDTSRWRVCASGHLWFNCSCESTMMIKKGSFDWYSPGKFMSDEAASVFNLLGELKELPHIPTAIMEMQSMIKDPEVSARQLAAAAKKEPLIASNILKMANTMQVATGAAIESLEHAISYIGLTQLNDIILAASIETFEFQTKIFSQESFWGEAMTTGVISEILCKKFTPQHNADEAYVAGTLCNIGKVIQAICFPVHADRVSRDINQPGLMGTWRKTEKVNGLYSHTILGEIGASFWGLPTFVLEAARNHHRVVSESPAEIELSDVVALANQFTHWILHQPHRMNENHFGKLKDLFSISSKMEESLAQELSNAIEISSKAAS